MKYNRCVVVGLVLAVFVGLSLSGCRPHSGVVDTGEEEGGGGGSGTTELEPRLESITFDSSAVTLTTEFRSSVFMYTADLNGSALSDLTIIAESTDQASIISYLADGQTIGNPAKGSIFVIKVDSSDHTKSSTYIVHLNDSGNLTPLEPALLSGITLTSGEITSFDTTAPASYDVMLPYGTKTVAVSAITANPSTHFVSYDPSNILNNPQNDDQIAINVVCSGRSVGTYVITFHIAAPLPSALTGISVSAGSVVSSGSEALVVDFNPNVTSYLIQVHRGAYTNMVVTGEVAIGDSVTYSPSNVISGTLDGKTITITVNEEADANRHIGYGPTVYTVTVQENDKIDAKLSDITFVPDNGTLYKWSGGSKTTNTGFDANCTTYTYKMNSPASITVTGQKTDSAVTVSYGGYTGYDATSPLSSPSAAKPLSIFATGPSGSHNATSYTVYFEWESAPLATLSSLSVPGAKFSNNSSTVLNPAAGNNNVTVPYGTTMFVVDAVPTTAGHIVTYSPASYSNPSANDTITVTVNGGPDFSTSTYIVKANIAAQQKPLLTSLSVSEISLTSRLSPNPSGIGSVLTYYRVLLDADGEFDDVDFVWTVNADTSTVKYSTNGTDPSVNDAEKDGFSGTSFNVGLGETKPVLIRLTSSDGTTTNYTINVTRKSDSGADLSSLLVNNVSVLEGLSMTDGMEIKPTFAAINSPSGAISLLATAANGGTVSWGGSASGSGVGSSSTSVSALVPGTPKTVTITISDVGGDDHLYTLVLFRTDAVYVAASGGSDSNTGQTADSPFATLRKALDTAKAEGFNKVMVSGTFTATNGGFTASANGVFILDAYGTGTPITISGTNSSTDILQGSGSGKRVVYISGGSKIKFENIAITGGTIQEGAGVYVEAGSTLIVGSGALIWKNSNTTNGGGVSLGGGTTNGGGASLLMSGGTISANSSGRGGGVYANLGNAVVGSAPKIIFESGLIGGSTLYTDGNTPDQGNKVTVWGGGIMFQAGNEDCGILTMSGGNISYNKLNGADSSYGGGGILLSGKGNVISGGSIDNNESSGFAGGINVWTGSTTISGNAVIRANRAGTSGGGIEVAPYSTTLNFYGGTIGGSSGADGNIANGEGGGISVKADAVVNFSGTATISNNKSENNKGGGAYISGVFNMDGGTINNNVAKDGGGGLRLFSGSTFIMKGGEISGNSLTDAGAFGSGVLVANCRFEMGGSAQVSANNDVYLPTGLGFTALNSLTASPAAKITPESFTNISLLSFPGAEKSANFTLNNAPSGWSINNIGMLENLSDTNTGTGFIYVKYGGNDSAAGTSPSTAVKTLERAATLAHGTTQHKVVVLGTLYQDDEALNTTDAAFRLVGSVIGTANTVTVTGGVLSARTRATPNTAAIKKVLQIDGGAKIILEYITLTDGRVTTGNTGAGGGLFVAVAGTQATLGAGTIITNNYAPTKAGGVYLHSGTLTIDGAIISNNSGGTSNASGEGGGGVWVDDGTFKFLSGSIINNTSSYAGGGLVYVRAGTAAPTFSGGTISGNSAPTKGAGIYLNKTVSMKNITITGNIGSGYGGGVYIGASGNLTLDENCLISGNTAISGGGIYNSGGSATIKGNTRIENNTVTTNGGGVWTGGASTDSVTMSGNAIITGNTAPAGAGGGVYKAAGTFTKGSGTVSGNIGGDVVP